MIFEKYYRLGFEAGMNAQKLTEKEDQNRRLEEMLHHGKKLGHDEGWLEGYTKGYAVGYSEGEMDTRAEVGEIPLDGIMAEVKDEYNGFKGLVNEEGVVDEGVFKDMTEAYEQFVEAADDLAEAMA